MLSNPGRYSFIQHKNNRHTGWTTCIPGFKALLKALVPPTHQLRAHIDSGDIARRYRNNMRVVAIIRTDDKVRFLRLHSITIVRAQMIREQDTDAENQEEIHRSHHQHGDSSFLKSGTNAAHNQ
jgi:hypothetical protein